MSVIFPESNLNVMDYNRVVHDLNGMTEDEFCDKLKEKFIIEPSKSPYKPIVNHTFGMYINKKWYKLTVKPEILKTDNNLETIDVIINTFK